MSIFEGNIKISSRHSQGRASENMAKCYDLQKEGLKI